MQESTMAHHEAYQKGLHDKSSRNNSDVLIRKFGPDSLRIIKVREGDQNKGTAGAPNLKNRPGRLVVPQYCPKMEFAQVDRKLESQQFEIQGRYFSLASRKGRREIMEDGYGVMIDILGDAKLVSDLNLISLSLSLSLMGIRYLIIFHKLINKL